jgi:hypothetical protein
LNNCSYYSIADQWSCYLDPENKQKSLPEQLQCAALYLLVAYGAQRTARRNIFTTHCRPYFCREKILTFQEVYLSQFFNASQQERKVSTGSNNFYMLA